MNLLCFKAGSTEVPSSGAFLRLVSLFLLDTNQLSMEGVKVLSFQIWPGSGEAGDDPTGSGSKEKPASSLHPLDETGVKDAEALREWNGKACRQVEACSALSSTVGGARDHNLSLTGPSVLAMAKVCRNHAAAAAAKSLQSCPTLCDPIDGSPPGSPIPGILQAISMNMKRFVPRQMKSNALEGLFLRY